MSMLFLEIFMMSALTIHTTGSLILLSVHLIIKEPADILDKCAAKITFQWLKLALLDTVVNNLRFTINFHRLFLGDVSTRIKGKFECRNCKPETK